MVGIATLLVAWQEALPAEPAQDEGHIRELVARLKSESFAARDSAWQELAKAGKSARPTLLLEFTEATEPELQERLARLLARIALEQLKDKVLPTGEIVLADHEQEVYEGLQGLADLGPRAIAVLRELLQDEELGARLSAAYALGRLGKRSQDAAAALREALGDRLRDVRAGAAAALARLGPLASEAAGRLQELAARDAPQVRCLAWAALRKIDPDGAGKDFDPGAIAQALNACQEADAQELLLRMAALPPRQAELRPAQPKLLALADSKDQRTRELAAVVLGRLGLSAQRVLPILVELARSGDSPREGDQPYAPGSRVSALEALAELGPAAQEATPVLLEAVKDASDFIAEQAVIALGRIGAPEPGVVQALMETIRSHHNWHMHRNAAQALGLLGPPAETALPVLREAQRSQSDYILRLRAEQAIRQILKK